MNSKETCVAGITPSTQGEDSSSGQALRPLALALLRKQAAQSPENLEALTPESARQLMHELSVHQIELEMQSGELRQALEGLAAARARYFDLYNLAPIGYCTVSNKGLILEANLAAGTLLGLPPSALVGQPIARFVFKEDQDTYYLYRKQLIESDEQQGLELRMVKSDGSQCLSYLAASVARGEDGALAVRIALTDITKRKETEAALASHHQTIQTILDTTPGFMVLKDSSGVYREVNLAFSNFLGKRHEEIVGKTDSELFPSDEAAAYRLGDAEVLQTRKLLRRDEQVTGAGGTRWMSVCKSPVVDGNGRALGIVCSVVDITERREIESELSKREEIFRNIVTQASDGVVLIDVETQNYVEFNDAACLALGYSRDEFARLRVTDIQGEMDAATVVQLLKEMEVAPQASFDTLHRHKDGSLRNAHVSSRTISISGRPHLVGIVSDITERKRAEEAARENAERISALSRRLLEVQEEERARLARELHDEIGQVLTAVRLHLKVIERELAPAVSNGLLEKSLGMIERAISQVRNLSLDLRPPELDELGLVAALRSLVQSFSGRGEGVLRIRLEVSSEKVALPRGTAETCYRIAQESLTNVLRHAAAKQALIRLESGAHSVAVSIRDDGRGFDAAGARSRGGFGLLGMEERVKLAGGTLRVHSTPGGGTEVRAEFGLGA